MITDEEHLYMWPLNANNWPGEDFCFEESELPYGWAGMVVVPTAPSFDDHVRVAGMVVTWLHDTVEYSIANARWYCVHDRVYVQLRKKKDYLWFITRWGCT